MEPMEFLRFLMMSTVLGTLRFDNVDIGADIPTPSNKETTK
jgi:hypothetical protein